MQLTDQVNTIAQGERLAELGITVMSALTWVCHSDREPYVETTSDLIDGWGMKTGQRHIRAFSAAELGMMLPETWPDTLPFVHDNTEISFYKIENAFGEGKILWFPNLIHVDLQQGWETEAIAKTTALVYLLEQKAITSEEVNQRLLKTDQ